MEKRQRAACGGVLPWGGMMETRSGSERGRAASVPADAPMEMFEDEDINLLEIWRVIWKRKWVIALIVLVSALTAAVRSVYLPNVYRAAAVLMPVDAEGARSGGGLLEMAVQFTGGSLAGGGNMAEVRALLGSADFKKRVIERYDLLPRFFPDAWDSESESWRQGGEGPSLLSRLDPRAALSRVVREIHASPGDAGGRGPDGTPDIREAIRRYEKMLSVSWNSGSSSLTVSIDHRDPRFAAELVNHTLDFLKECIRSDAVGRARRNKAYLVEQLADAGDPIIRNKIYSLIVAQIEKETMAGNVDGYAFKVIDPPMIPDRKIKPNRARMVLWSGVAGLMLGGCATLFADSIRKARKNSITK